MIITFVDKNGRTVRVQANSEEQAHILLALLRKLPDSEFIISPSTLNL